MTSSLHPYDPARQIAALERRVADLERRLSIRQMDLRPPGLPSWVADTRGDTFTGDTSIAANLGVTQTLTVLGNASFDGTVDVEDGITCSGATVQALNFAVVSVIHDAGAPLGSSIEIQDSTKTIFLSADSGGGTGTIQCNGDVTLTSGKKFVGRIKANAAGGTEGISFGWSGTTLNIYKDGTLTRTFTADT